MKADSPAKYILSSFTFIYVCSQSEIYFISFSFVSLVKVKLEINLTVNINEALYYELYYILFGKIVRDMVSN